MTLETTVEEFNQTQFVAGLAKALKIEEDLVTALEVNSGSIVTHSTIKASSKAGAPTQDEVKETFLSTSLATLSEDVGYTVSARSVVETGSPGVAEEESSAGIIAGAVVGSVVVLLLVVCVCRRSGRDEGSSMRPSPKKRWGAHQANELELMSYESGHHSPAAHSNWSGRV